MSITTKISNAVGKLKGETSTEVTDAQLASDSTEKAELPESGLYQVLSGNSLEAVAGVAAA